MNENEANLNKNYLELTELHHIVTETAQFFTEVCVCVRGNGSLPSGCVRAGMPAPLLGYCVRSLFL